MHRSRSNAVSPYHSPAYKAAVKVIGSARAGKIIGDYMTAHANEPVRGDWKADAYRMEQEAANAVIAAANALRSNPAPAAAALYESWTGEPSTHETVVTETVYDHAHLTDLAQLLGFKLRGVPGQLKFTNAETRLCANETGTQLYIRGGDQSINLSEFNRITRRPVDPKKDSVVLGEITDVFYRARKPFLGGEHKKTGTYHHKLGDKQGNRPVLIYDTRSQLLSISGGVYYIKKGDYDGKHSRGIVN
jgi:hypothetical protein